MKRVVGLGLRGVVLLVAMAVVPGCDEGSGEYAADGFQPDWSDIEAELPYVPEDARNWDVPPVPGKCWGEDVAHTPCLVGPCECVEFSGSLSGGGAGPVEWLAESECVPAEQQSKFAANHLFYATELSAWCGVFACVTPKDPLVNLSLYAVRMDALSCTLPPAAGSFFECDAAWDAASAESEEWTGNLGASCASYAQVKAANTLCVEVTSGTEPQNYLVGVTGAQGLTGGDFTLHFIWRTDCGT